MMVCIDILGHLGKSCPSVFYYVLHNYRSIASGPNNELSFKVT